MLLNAWMILLGLELALTVLLLAFMFFPRFDNYIARTILWRDVGYYAPVYVAMAWLANGWTCFVPFVLVIKDHYPVLV